MIRLMRMGTFAASTVFAIGTMLATSACGSVNANSDGGGQADAAVDGDGSIIVTDGGGGPDATAVGLLGVTVYSTYGYKYSGAPVIVQNPDGSFKTRIVTDNAGHAQAEVHRGDMLTVIVDDGTSGVYRISYTGVAPGDNITVGDERQLYPDSNLLAQMVEHTSLFPGGALYGFDIGCQYAYTTSPGPNDASLTQYIYTPCYQSTSDVVTTVAYALDANSKPLAYRLGTPLVSNANFTFTNAWQTNFSQLNLNIDQTDPDPGAYGFFSAYLDVPPQHLYQLWLPLQDQSAGDPIHLAVPLPGNVPGSLVYGFKTRLYMSGFEQDRYAVHRKSTNFAGNADVSYASLLPAISAGTLVATADASRPNVSWTVGAGGHPDVTLSAMRWYSQATQQQNYWIFVTPPGSTTVRTPELTGPDASYALTVDDSASYFGTAIIDSSLLAGYDAARQIAPSFRWLGVYDVYQAAAIFGPADDWDVLISEFIQGRG